MDLTDIKNTFIALLLRETRLLDKLSHAFLYLAGGSVRSVTDSSPKLVFSFTCCKNSFQHFTLGELSGVTRSSSTGNEGLW